MKAAYEVAAEIKTAKQAFDSLHGAGGVYREVGECILEVVKAAGSWQGDIASRALAGSELSVKQQWCVAFAYVSLDHSRETVHALAC